MDLIGRTPLVRLSKFERETPGVELYAKAEWQNPGGSVKDRAAARMIADGEAHGVLTPGLTIVDATSGNTGIAYSMIGAARGYRVKLFLPENGRLASFAPRLTRQMIPKGQGVGMPMEVF